jgi:hypothetical protein
MTKFRKKPVVIDAVQYNPIGPGSAQFFNDMPEWLEAAYDEEPAKISNVMIEGKNKLEIKTLEGIMHAEVGDWIIRGIKGELYPCRDDIFRATYEKV